MPFYIFRGRTQVNIYDFAFLKILSHYNLKIFSEIINTQFR